MSYHQQLQYHRIHLSVMTLSLLVYSLGNFFRFDKSCPPMMSTIALDHKLESHRMPLQKIQMLLNHYNGWLIPAFTTASHWILKLANQKGKWIPPWAIRIMSWLRIEMIMIMVVWWIRWWRIAHAVVNLIRTHIITPYATKTDIRGRFWQKRCMSNLYD